MESNSPDYSPNSPSKNVQIPDYDLQLPAWSLECLKTAAVELRLSRPRSLAWAILLNALPPPVDDNLVKGVTAHRNNYEDLKAELSMDPRAVDGDDPLSQDDESAWKQHFCDNELKAVIMQDVIRTYPDEIYFRLKDVQDMMVRILFYWARSQSNIGYRQGMHEILAPLLYETHMDIKHAPSNLSEPLKFYLDSNYLEHNSYMLFSSVMKGLEKFYTTCDAIPSSSGRMPKCAGMHHPNEVIRYLENQKEMLLIQVDPELAEHLSECNVTMELFGIRWLRLLFGREFPRNDIPLLWGYLFSAGPLMPHVNYVLIAMLVAVRNLLLDPDPGMVLSILMRPSLAPVRYICELASNLRDPGEFPRRPPPLQRHELMRNKSTSPSWSLEHYGSEGPSGSNDSDEGVAEGADVARELAALALVRAQLPRAAAKLVSALPKPCKPEIAQPLQQILQLAALLQCRNHALVDVETALEAAEGQSADNDNLGRKQLVPVSVIAGSQTPSKQKPKSNQKAKEVQLKVFNTVECSTSDFPSLDPLRGLRSE